jgi:hypothetical protein
VEIWEFGSCGNLGSVRYQLARESSARPQGGLREMQIYMYIRAGRQGGSLTVVVEDLVEIWGAAVTGCLEIPFGELQVCSRQPVYPGPPRSRPLSGDAQNCLSLLSQNVRPPHTSSLLQHYRAVLLIPDLYDRVHLREMLHVLLDRLGFGSAFVVQVRLHLGFF